MKLPVRMPISPHDRQRACQRGVARVGPAEDTCDDSTQSSARQGVSSQVGLRSGSPARPQVTRCMGLSGSDREYPVLTGRSGMQRARRCPVTARTVQGMAPYPGQARCLALGFWPECFRRLDVKGGRRPFPEETRSALDIEGKHVTIQGPSPDRGCRITDKCRRWARVGFSPRCWPLHQPDAGPGGACLPVRGAGGLGGGLRLR